MRVSHGLNCLEEGNATSNTYVLLAVLKNKKYIYIFFFLQDGNIVIECEIDCR